MSADVFVFHSDELVKSPPVAAGWYVGSANQDGELTADGATGPFATEGFALAAMQSGAWI